jgi:hypothetical protein
MPYSLLTDETAARQRMRAFWRGEGIDRPALLVQVDRHLPPPVNPYAHLSEKERDLIPGFHAWNCSSALDFHDHLAESFPVRGVWWGSCIMTLPVLAGADYGYHGSAWTVPIPDALDRPAPGFDPGHPLIRALDACYDAAIPAIGDRAVLTSQLMMDGLTALAELRTPAGLCSDLIERPDDVKRWAAALTDIYIATYERYYRRIGRNESVCFWGPFAEGRSEGVQCDFAVMMSPAMFREFVVPDLSRVCAYMDYPLYHLDGVAQMRFIDQLAAIPNLRGIQWNPENSYGQPMLHLAHLRRIRELGMTLFVHANTAEEAAALTRELGPQGLFIKLPPFPDRAAAEAAIRSIEAASAGGRQPTAAAACASSP